MIRLAVKIIAAACCAGLAAFLWFIVQLPLKPLDEPVKTDAIIVLTGGTGRVEQGLIALANGDAPILFISGVGQHTTRRQMLRAHARPETLAKLAEQEEDTEIVFDYVASTTKSNADQAAKFVEERHLRSIRLITSNYHMPRSLLEFRMQMPKVQIIADPVFPSDESRHHWWQDKTTRKLVYSEFGKYYAALFLRNRPQ